MTEKVEVQCPLCEFKCRKDHIGRHLCRSNHISEIVSKMTPDEYNKLYEHPFIFKRDSEQSIDYAVCLVCFKSFFNDGKTKEEKDEKYESFERLHKNSKFNCFDLTKIATQREKFKKFIPVPKEKSVITLLANVPQLIVNEEKKDIVIETPIEEKQPIIEEKKEEPPKVEEPKVEENKIELVYNDGKVETDSHSQNDEEIEYLIEEYKKLKTAAFEREKELLEVIENYERSSVSISQMHLVDSICYGELEEDLDLTNNQKIAYLVALYKAYKRDNLALNKKITYLETILED